MPDMVYFDNSATTGIYPEVLHEMTQIYVDFFGNPSSLHRLGSHAEKVLEKARMEIAGTLGVSESEIYFTSGGTESNNWAIKGISRANRKRGNKIVTSATEHPSVLECFHYLEKEDFFCLISETDDSGLLNPERFIEQIDSQTILVSFILVNNETGAIQNAEKIIRAIRTKNPAVVIHMDAVQAYGKIPINLKRLDCDLVSLSAHKIHGPRGCGALYIRKNTKILPILHGGGQERKLRSGTENVPAIHGFATAAKIMHRDMKKNRDIAIRLKTTIIEGLTRHFGSDNFFMNSPSDAYEGICNIAFPRVKAQVLMHHLETENVFVSVGSACSSRKNTHSHVLKAMNLPKECMEGAIRLSFSGMNTVEQANRFVEVIKTIIPKIRY